MWLSTFILLSAFFAGLTSYILVTPEMVMTDWRAQISELYCGIIRIVAVLIVPFLVYNL